MRSILNLSIPDWIKAKVRTGEINLVEERLLELQVTLAKIADLHELTKTEAWKHIEHALLGHSQDILLEMAELARDVEKNAHAIEQLRCVRDAYIGVVSSVNRELQSEDTLRDRLKNLKEQYAQFLTHEQSATGT